jgi:hypothetical protein
MTLPSSGGITIAQILAEIGDSFPVTIPNANWRTLAGKPTGSLVIPTDFYGKSWRSVTQTDSRTTAATSFSTVSFGEDDTRRRIVVLVWHGDTNSNPGTIPTATIGGVAATRIAAESTGDDTSGSDATGCAIFIANPTGTTGTVSVSWTAHNVTIVVLRLVGYSATPTASGAEANGGSDGHFPLSSAANGCIIAAAGQGQGAGTNMVWTNITERGDENVGGGNNRRTWAWDTGISAGTITPTVTPWASAQGSNAMVAVTFPVA